MGRDWLYQISLTGAWKRCDSRQLRPSWSLVEGDRLHKVIEANAKTRGIAFAEAEAEFVSYIAMKKMVTPQEIADAILFLCSPRGRTISGQAISVCGDVQMLF